MWALYGIATLFRTSYTMKYDGWTYVYRAGQAFPELHEGQTWIEVVW